MITFGILLRRRPGVTHEEFVSYHRDNPAPLVVSLPAVRQHVRRHVQQHTLDVRMPGLPATTIDGVTDVWFDDVESIAAVFTDESCPASIRPDEATFLDLEHSRPRALRVHRLR